MYEGVRSKENEFDTLLTNIRLENLGRVIVATININSIRNKFDELKLLIAANIDVLIITETKLDETFTMANFE